ncbi:hypothetical protein J2S09_002198 [Bacillus fengqiuensis]|nr:hypothetical protein [Bacillus fengqiuensis]
MKEGRNFRYKVRTGGSCPLEKLKKTAVIKNKKKQAIYITTVTYWLVLVLPVRQPLFFVVLPA